MTTTDQVCATCTTAITVTSRNPTKRYCSPRCRVAHWHRHHDRPTLSTMQNDGPRNDVHNVDPEPGNAVPDAGTAFTNSANGVPHGANAANGEQRCRPTRTAPPPAPAAPKIREVVRWILTKPDNLDADQRQHLDRILARSPHLAAAAHHVTAFADMMTNLTGHRLPEWTAAVIADDLPALHSFVTGIQCDLDR